MIKRIVLPGLVVGIVMLSVGILLSMAYMILFPGLRDEYTDSSLFRTMTDPRMRMYFVHPILVGLLLSWIWDKTKDTFSQKLPGWQKGVRFAMIYTLFSLCGMLITYSTFPVSLLMVSTWAINTFIEGMIGSLLLSAFNESKGNMNYEF